MACYSPLLIIGLLFQLSCGGHVQHKKDPSYDALMAGDIRTVVRQHLDEIRICYDSYGTRQEKQVVVRFVISNLGNVREAKVIRQSRPNRLLAECMEASLLRWSFMPPQDGQDIVATYPFHFTNLEDGTTTASANTLPCEIDPLLQKVASEFVDRFSATHREVKARAQALGADPGHFLFSFSKGPQSSTYEKLRHFSFAANAPLRCGLATKNGIWSIVATPNLARLKVTQHGKRLQVHASWHKDYHKASLWLRSKGGGIQQHPLNSPNAASVDIEIPAPKHLVKVQLTGVGPLGGRVLAERWINVSNTSAASVSSPEAWLSQIRKEANAPTNLRRNPTLNSAALSHSQHMCQSGRVAHNLGDGDVQERLGRYGFFGLSGEVICLAPTIGDALQSLGDSPGHYATLVHRDLSDWGFAAVKCKENYYFVTLILAKASPTARPEGSF